MGERHLTLGIEGFWNVITLFEVFNGCKENKTTPLPLTGEEVYNRVCHVQVTFGETLKNSGAKKSYWRRNRYYLNFHIGQI